MKNLYNFGGCMWVKSLRLNQNNKANNMRTIHVIVGNEYDTEINYLITSRNNNDTILIEYYKENVNFQHCLLLANHYIRKEDLNIVNKLARKYQKWLRFETDIKV
jgi:hypothetical protein